MTREKRPRGLAGRLAMLSTLCLTLALLLVLGTWQVQRLAWKRALIAQVDSRIRAEPTAIQPPQAWAAMDTQAEAYRRVRLSGRLLEDKRLFVYASTDLGPGYWAMTPMLLASEPRAVVWINQGYVTNEQRRQLAARPPPPGRPAAGLAAGAPVSISGLLRPSEAYRFYMRENVPAENRWYVRTLDQMSQAAGLGAGGLATAPFFVDADRDPDPQAFPLGGLTRVHFSDNHLVYALTWYGLAALNAAVLVFLVRTEWLPRRRRPGPA